MFSIYHNLPDVASNHFRVFLEDHIYVSAVHNTATVLTLLTHVFTGHGYGYTPPQRFRIVACALYLNYARAWSGWSSGLSERLFRAVTISLSWMLVRDCPSKTREIHNSLCALRMGA